MVLGPEAAVRYAGIFIRNQDQKILFEMLRTGGWKTLTVIQITV